MVQLRAQHSSAAAATAQTQRTGSEAKPQRGEAERPAQHGNYTYRHGQAGSGAPTGRGRLPLTPRTAARQQQRAQRQQRRQANIETPNTESQDDTFASLNNDDDEQLRGMARGVPMTQDGAEDDGSHMSHGHEHERNGAAVAMRERLKVGRPRQHSVAMAEAEPAAAAASSRVREAAGRGEAPAQEALAQELVASARQAGTPSGTSVRLAAVQAYLRAGGASQPMSFGDIKALLTQLPPPPPGPASEQQGNANALTPLLLYAATRRRSPTQRIASADRLALIQRAG